MERHEILAVRLGNKRVTAWCSECRREVVMISPDEAAVLAELSGREIHRHVEAGLIHATNEGPFLVCLTSLAGIIAPDRTADGQQI